MCQASPVTSKYSIHHSFNEFNTTSLMRNWNISIVANFNMLLWEHLWGTFGAERGPQFRKRCNGIHIERYILRIAGWGKSGCDVYFMDLYSGWHLGSKFWYSDSWYSWQLQVRSCFIWILERPHLSLLHTRIHDLLLEKYGVVKVCYQMISQ